MVAVSLMPPVDQCASCEGKRAESRARDVAQAREAVATDQLGQNETIQPSPGALPPPSVNDVETKPVDTVARPLLSPDLTVQASLGNAQSSATDEGANPALRLQAFHAYGTAPGKGFGP